MNFNQILSPPWLHYLKGKTINLTQTTSKPTSQSFFILSFYVCLGHIFNSLYFGFILVNVTLTQIWSQFINVSLIYLSTERPHLWPLRREPCSKLSRANRLVNPQMSNKWLKESSLHEGIVKMTKDSKRKRSRASRGCVEWWKSHID